MAYIPLSQQQQRLGQQRLAVAPTRMQAPVPLQQDMMVKPRAGPARATPEQLAEMAKIPRYDPAKAPSQEAMRQWELQNQIGRAALSVGNGRVDHFGDPIMRDTSIGPGDPGYRDFGPPSPEELAKWARPAVPREGRAPIRQQTRELYRDPYEQGNLPPELLDPGTGRPPIGINDPDIDPNTGRNVYQDFDEPPPRLTYEIGGVRPPPELGVEPPAPTPQTPELTQDPGSLKLPDFSTMSPSDFTWLDNILQTVGGTIGDYFKNPMAYPAIATAFQQYKNSKTYGDDREQYRKEGNPYGPYREAAAQRLEKLYADPSSIADTPGYKFRLSQGMGNLSGKQAAAHQGWGNEFGAMQNYAQGLASTEYGNEVERLMKQAGVNISPEASLSAQTTARGQQLQSELGALQALATPFGQNSGDNRQQDLGLGQIPTGGYKVSDVINGILKTSNGTQIDYNALVRAAASGDPTAIATYQKLFLQTPPGTPPDQGYEFGGNNPSGPPEQYGPPEPNYPDPGDGSMGPPEFDPFDPQGFDGFFDP